MAPGVSESFGTIPGSFSGAPSGRPMLLQHAARLVVHVADDVGDVVDLAARHLGRGQHLQHLVQIVLRTPATDDLVQLLGARDAAFVARESWVVGQILDGRSPPSGA